MKSALQKIREDLSKSALPTDALPAQGKLPTVHFSDLKNDLQKPVQAPQRNASNTLQMKL